MQVERGATPDGRLLLYFTFRKPDDEPHAPREGDGAVARSPHPRPLSLNAGEGRRPSPPAPLPECGRGETRTPPLPQAGTHPLREREVGEVGKVGACDLPPDAEA
jgi:hypothetical protein